MIHKPSRTVGSVLTALCLALSVLAPSARAAAASDATGGASARALPKRLVLLRAGAGAPDGSRVEISSDSPLDDCESFREGDDFSVRNPWAVSAGARGLSPEGRFYKSARVEEQGDAVLVTFGLREGASARLARGFNRLEVTFAGPAAPPANS